VGQPPPCTGRDGRWSTLLCLAAEDSARLGCEIDLAQYAAAEAERPLLPG
jgi:hypothetical protein